MQSNFCNPSSLVKNKFEWQYRKKYAFTWYRVTENIHIVSNSTQQCAIYLRIVAPSPIQYGASYIHILLRVPNRHGSFWCS